MLLRKSTSTRDASREAPDSFRRKKEGARRILERRRPSVASAADGTVAARVVGDWAYRDPFSGADWTGADAIALLGDWRRLIDANRPVAAVFGVARWKRETLDALLWDGAGPVRHAGKVAAGAMIGEIKTLAPAVELPAIPDEPAEED